MADRRLREIDRAIKSDDRFQSKLFWEYRQQALDQIECIQEIHPDLDRENRLLDEAHDCALIAWSYQPED